MGRIQLISMNHRMPFQPITELLEAVAISYLTFYVTLKLMKSFPGDFFWAESVGFRLTIQVCS